jgi:ubiquinone/menaquinone biosynthesis C-methylase UbiE
MTHSLIQSSYEPFSREPEYVEVNRCFVAELGLNVSKRILDVACGTGTLTELACNEIRSQDGKPGPGSDRHTVEFIGLDLSMESLALARKRMIELELFTPEQVRRSTSNGTGSTVTLVQGSADCLPFADRSMQAVLMGNAIQLIDNKKKLVREVNRVLCRNAVFAFNTSFYAGTFPEGTEQFYIRWLQLAIDYIKQKNEELKKQGLPVIARRRGVSKPAFSQGWLSSSEYEQLLAGEGFVVKSIVQRTVLLTRHNLEAIGSYSGLASVLLSGYPVGLACEALEQSVGPALDAMSMKIVPRYWIEFVAHKL